MSAVFQINSAEEMCNETAYYIRFCLSVFETEYIKIDNQRKYLLFICSVIEEADV